MENKNMFLCNWFVQKACFLTVWLYQELSLAAVTPQEACSQNY